MATEVKLPTAVISTLVALAAGGVAGTSLSRTDPKVSAEVISEKLDNMRGTLTNIERASEKLGERVAELDRRTTKIEAQLTVSSGETAGMREAINELRRKVDALPQKPGP